MNPAIPATSATPATPATPAEQKTPHSSAETDDKERIDLAAVSLTSKIPDFWPDQPRVWFIRTEAILAPQKVGHESKFNIVVSKLGKEVIQQVTDVLVNPPEKGKYDTLRTRLLNIYEESENWQLQKLIGEMELGEQKPSQLLRQMRELARGKVPDETLRILWQGHLPQAARAVLSVTEIKELESLAKIADKILETTRPTSSTVAEVTQASSSNSKILAEISKINVRLNNIDRARSRQRGNNGNGYRNRSWSAPASRSASRTPKPNRLCFYHFRFRERAQKCSQPCAWVDRQEKKEKREEN